MERRITSLIWSLLLEKRTCCRVCSRPATYCSMVRYEYEGGGGKEEVRVRKKKKKKK
jgi:hypothetical protein